MFERVNLDVSSSEIRLRTPLAHLPTMLAGVGAVIVGVSMVVSLRPASAGSVALGLASVGGGVWILVSESRAHISLTSSRLAECGNLRKRDFAATDIIEVFVDRTPHVVPWFSIWVRLHSGEAYPLQQARVLGFRRGRGVEELKEAAAAMSDWLLERQ